MPGAEPHGFAGAVDNHRGATQTHKSPSDPEQTVIRNRTHSAAPSDRQRTVQACDKCRERKTKCSGDHPVCQRCTTRGLVCQYSSREPRTRGPSKARLRNAVSSSDLRCHGGTVVPPANQLSHGTGACGGHHPTKHDQPAPPIQHHYRSQAAPRYEGNIRGGYAGLRRVASIPRTHFNSRQPVGRDPVSTTVASYDNWRGPAAGPAPPSPFSFDESSFRMPHFNIPSVHFGTAAPSTPHHTGSQWRDVRRVQSQSTLIPNNTDLRKSTEYDLQSPLALVNSDGCGDFFTAEQTSYVQMPASALSLERHSPDFVMPMRTFQPLPLHAPEIHSWTSSDPLSASSGDSYLAHSPSSSEDAPSRPKSSSASAASSFQDIASPQAIDFLSLSAHNSSGNTYSANSDINSGNYFLTSQPNGGLTFDLNDQFNGLDVGSPSAPRSAASDSMVSSSTSATLALQYPSLSL